MNPYAAQLDWIKTQHEAMVHLVAQWAHINSGSYHQAGLEELLSHLKDGFRILDGEIKEIELMPHQVVDSRGEMIRKPLGNALAIRKRSTAPLRIFLGAHMDTVYPADHPFQKAVRVDQNTLQGPGVADSKGGLVVMLKALEALERSPYAQSVGWEVLINPDEELGSPSSAPLLAQSAQNNHLGLVFEPTLPDGALVGARKGSGNFTAVVRGRTAHAGREYDRGRNAILALAELMVAFNHLNGAKPGITLNLGQVEGGGPVNIVPDLAIGRFNIRIREPEEGRFVKEYLTHVISEMNQRDGISVQLHGSFSCPPKPLNGDTLWLLEQIAACGRDLGIAIQWKPSGGVCDGNRLAAAGLPTVDSLGVRGGFLHTPQEYLLLDSLVERAQLVALLLMKLGFGEIPWPPLVEV